MRKPDTTRVINPPWRELDSQIRRQNALLSRQLVKFAEIQLPQDLEPEAVQAYELSKDQLQQQIESRRQEIEQPKARRKALTKHILLKDLPEQDCRFQQLRAEKKHFLDTIKLIAYRAETALAQLARDKMRRLVGPAAHEVDKSQGTGVVTVHGMYLPSSCLANHWASSSV